MRTTLRRFAGGLALIAGSICACPPLAAIGGNATIGGAFIKGPADDRASRERVPLTATNGLLSGRPRHSSIVLIAIYAPGSTAAHVILRESAVAEGVRTVLLTGPASLTAGTRRVTLFVRSHGHPIFLAEYGHSRRAVYTPALLPWAAGVVGDERDSIAAFVLGGFTGPWLLGPEEGDFVGATALERLARPALAASVRRGFHPWIWSLALLLAAFFASRLAHYTDTRTR